MKSKSSVSIAYVLVTSLFAATVAAAVAPQTAAKRQPAPTGFTRVATPFRHVVCVFSTELAPDENDRNANVRLAAAMIDGTVLQHGQTFSLNSVVGTRTVEAGFRSAPTLTDFGRVDGVGGGVCQLAGTLYNAALLANLDIVERHPHGTPIRYLAPGRDATVSPVDDLKFANTLGNPVRLSVRVVGHRLVCRVESNQPAVAGIRIEVRTRKLPDGSLLAQTYRVGKSRESVSEDVYGLPSDRDR